VEEKAAGFLKAPAGIVGLETAVGIAARAMIDDPPLSPLCKGGRRGVADWLQLIAWFTTGPARVLRRRVPTVEVGAPANLTLIDPRTSWVVNPAEFCSKGRNTPFESWTLAARSVATIQGRRISRLAPVVGTA